MKIFRKCLPSYSGLITISKKPFYITTRGRPSREKEDVISSKRNIPDLIYYTQMKEFMKEAQGLPPQSLKWIELRNKHYRIMNEKSQTSHQNFKQTLDTQFLRFYVLVVPEEVSSYQLISILNFYNIRYKALEDSPISRSIMKQMLGVFNTQGYKNKKFPFLMFETSEEPTQTFDGFDNVIQFLIENNFIHDFRTHSVYEKDGLKFTDSFDECLGNLMKKFGNRFSFFFRSTNFKEARYWYHPFKDGYVYRNRIFSKIYRMGKELIKDFKFYFQSSKTKKLFYTENEANLNNLICTWIQRLNLKPFHGGDVPDAADFKLYSIIRKYQNCRGINFLLKKLANADLKSQGKLDIDLIMIKFDDWLSRMTMLCSRDNYYNIREVGYNYNRFLSEDIIESEKITKNLNLNLNKENSDTDSTNVSNGDSKKSNTSNSKKFITGVFGNKIKRNKINF